MWAEHTPYDLTFTLGRIPVRVLPSFWLSAVLLGWNPERLDLVILWALCQFISILVHELGHAWTAQAMGYPCEITMHLFGGYASYRAYYIRPAKTLLISVAGPATGLLFAGLIVSTGVVNLSHGTLSVSNEHYAYIIQVLLLMNILWSVFNLLPVLPLDGGQILLSLLQSLGIQAARMWALRVSLVIGVLMAFLAFRYQLSMAGVLLIIMSIENWQKMQSKIW